MNQLINRPEYIEKLISFKDQNLIKVITGLRRSGKSTLFQLFISYLKSIGVGDRQIIQVNFDDPSFEIATADELYNYVLERAGTDKKTYVFLDEVQMVPDFQKAVNGLRLRENLDVYITGSNAYLLSGQLATLLSGRQIEIHVLPLSFKEYLSGLQYDISDIELLKRKVNLSQLLLDYMHYGGLPQTLDYYDKRDGVAIPDSVRINEYLENIVGTIVYKDIMLRHNVTDRNLLERVAKFILDNVGQPLSVKKIVDTMNGNQLKTSFYTVENYIQALEECFLIYKAERYDVRGRELLSTGYKYYVSDTGLRNHLLGRTARQDISQLLENVVYIELLRRRFHVTVGKFDNLEIDFIANKSPEQLEYYQVSKDVSDAATLERELNPLLGVEDNYPKHLLTYENSNVSNDKGIIVENVAEWLIG